MWSNCLKVLISSGLVLSFLFATTGATAGADSTTNLGSEDSVAPPASPEHWISAVSFQKIEAGSFMMGSPKTESGRTSDEDQVAVTISKPFEIMTTEVTQSQWLKVMGSNPSRFKSEGDCDDYDSENEMCPNNPVEQVSWNEVQEYIEKLNDSLGLTGCNGTPSSSLGCYRLPTEAEWEYATRGGTNTAYSFGDDSSDLGDYAWYYRSSSSDLGDYTWHYRDNSDSKTHPVASKEANPYGLYDVHGNVWEWVQDKYTTTLPGGDDPLYISSGSFRVIRGGSWDLYAHYLRSAVRSFDVPVYGYGFLGFRLVRTL